VARWRFWAVAFAFLVVMMFATLPGPLYGAAARPLRSAHNP
jgi:hypothetical protein